MLQKINVNPLRLCPDVEAKCVLPTKTLALEIAQGRSARLIPSCAPKSCKSFRYYAIKAEVYVYHGTIRVARHSVTYETMAWAVAALPYPSWGTGHDLFIFETKSSPQKSNTYRIVVEKMNDERMYVYDIEAD